MNKQELQKKYQEIVLKTNGGNDDYVVALCQIANAINELDEPKKDTKWSQLKVWLKNQITDLRHIEIKTETQSLRVNDAVNCFKQVLNQIKELEGEDE